jgi:YD repeat-containing protein
MIPFTKSVRRSDPFARTQMRRWFYAPASGAIIYWPAHRPGVPRGLSYNSLNKVTSIVYPGNATVTLTYDTHGNLTSVTDPMNNLAEYQYDSRGIRLTMSGQSPPPSQTTVYTYDFEGRLIELDSPGLTAQYKYDPFGRRIEKNVNGVITRYVYDGPNIVAEYDGNWNLVTKYLPSLAIDDPLAMEQGAGSYFYHKDGLGSISDLTNTSGSAVKNYRYRSFGEIYSETGTLDQPFTFTGREYDPESGLYFYRARYYDPRGGGSSGMMRQGTDLRKRSSRRQLP